MLLPEANPTERLNDPPGFPISSEITKGRQAICPPPNGGFSVRLTSGFIGRSMVRFTPRPDAHIQASHKEKRSRG